MSDDINVLKFLQFSEDARLNEAALKVKYGIDVKFINNDITDTQGFILVRPEWITKAIVISFRGSQQLKDWLNDFNAWHKVIPYGNTDSKIKVHQGFLKCYKSVRGEILQFVQKNKYNYPNVCVTGHSLGGALALLCAVDIQYNNPDLKLVVYTSGAPSVGNYAFARSYNQRVADTTRTYARGDIVTKCPPWWFGPRIRNTHVETANPIGPNDFWVGLKYFFKVGRKFAEHITNHSIDLYKKWC